MRRYQIIAVATLLACPPMAYAASRSSVSTNVNSHVYTSSNSDVVADDNVVINGPVVRGRNRTYTGVNDDIIYIDNSGYLDDDDVYVDDDTVDVGNGAVHIGNGKPKKHAFKSKRKYISSQQAGAGVSKQVYRSGDCTVERKQVGSMVKHDTYCP